MPVALHYYSKFMCLIGALAGGAAAAAHRAASRTASHAAALYARHRRQRRQRVRRRAERRTSVHDGGARAQRGRADHVADGRAPAADERGDARGDPAAHEELPDAARAERERAAVHGPCSERSPDAGARGGRAAAIAAARERE